MSPGRFYILGIKERRFWGVSLYFSGSQVVILEFDEKSDGWKETVWDKNDFDFEVEVEQAEGTLPFNKMKGNHRRKTIKGIMNA